MYSQGMLDFTTVVESQLELLDAELDYADTNEERIWILTSQAKSAAELVEITDARFQAGRVAELDVLRAKALQLRIKIKLLRIRQNIQDKKTQ
jgi:outer membrane protein TolC